MNIHSLEQKLSDGTFKGYINQSDIKGSGTGFDKLFKTESVRTSSLLENYFSQRTNLETIDKIIKFLQKDNIEGWFNIKEYQGKIVGYKQLIKDSTNNFSLEINRGYIFEDSDKSDFSKKRFQKSETSKNYYKGFGQIKIYALDDADKLYQLACKQYNNKKLFIGSFLSIPTAPIFAIIFTKYIDTGINISFFAPFIPILVGYYLATKSSNKEQQISSRIREIKPIYQGSDAINELSRIYGISL